MRRRLSGRFVWCRPNEVVTRRKNHWLTGMLIGAGAGMLIGAFETPGCNGNDGDCYTRGENIGYGGLGFGLVVALVGALYRTDQWADVPLSGTASRVARPRKLAVVLAAVLTRFLWKK